MKKFLSFLLMISVVLGLFAALPMTAGAKGEMPVSINWVDCYYADDAVTANINFGYANEGGVIYLALYEDGKLVQSEQAELAAGDTLKTIEIANVDESYVGYEARVLCWGGFHKIAPISEAYVTYVTSEMIMKLKAVSRETEPFLDRTNAETYTIFNSTERYILSSVKVCIDDAIENHANEIDGDFVKTNYQAEIADVHEVYDQMVDEGKDDAFIGKLASNYTTENLIWLADTLGVDLEKYGIDVSKYR